MPECNAPLTNLGSGDCKLQIGLIRRILFVSQKKEDNTRNTIAIADAVTTANWQALFDIPNFESNPLEKVVPSDKVYLAKSEQGDVVAFDEDSFYEKLEDGTYDITFQLNSIYPDKVKAYKALELLNVSVWLVDADGKIWGIKNGTNLDPIDLVSIAVQNFNLKTTDSISKEMVKMRVNNPANLNDLSFVELSDGDPLDESDFYSLIDVGSVGSSPAVTGSVVVLSTKRYSEAVTGLVYIDFGYYDAVAPTVKIPLAASGSLTESPNGTYTINEAALLTSGHTYTLKISHDGYDIDTVSVVVP